MSTIHATALLVGEHALLLRGPSGCGKSHLTLELIRQARQNGTIHVRLIADDRVHVEAASGKLLARAAPALAGMMEERHRGLIEMPHEPCGEIAAVLDFQQNAPRLPAEEEAWTEILGVKIPRFFHPPKTPLSLMAAFDITRKASLIKRL